MNSFEGRFGRLPLGVASDRKLSFGAKTLYAVLDCHKNEKTKACFPSNQTLSDETGTSVRNITRLLIELKESGWINFNGSQSAVGYHRQIDFLK